MSLSVLRELAGRASEYIRFEDLEPNSYRILKTSIMEKSNYDDKSRLLLHLEDGYVILPPRFNELFDKRNIMKELNSGKFALVYKGKAGKRLLISFDRYKATGDQPTKKRTAETATVESGEDDTDDEEEGNGGHAEDANKRRKKNNA